MSTTTHPSRAVEANQPASRGAIAAAVIGNWLEFFDFTVYGFFAVIIGKLYFPSADPTTRVAAVVATFGVGLHHAAARQHVLGVYADREGRKAALNLTIMLMAVSARPDRLRADLCADRLAAPLLIVFARLVQGFSQGGEFGAATSSLLEQGGGTRRGFRASWQLASKAARR